LPLTRVGARKSHIDLLKSCVTARSRARKRHA
jgi:hypothetical protein